MSDASTFPITEEYGWQQGYPLHTTPTDPAVPPSEKAKYPGSGYGFHTGVDWGCPVGTPIVVNGVVIGISGATGTVFGAHVHVGKFVNGVCTNPGHNPWKFTSAIVAEVNQDSTNGKYVAINADGARYVYLHMSDNSKVKVGQTLQGGDMQLTPTEVDMVIKMGLRRPSTEAELNNPDYQKDAGLLVNTIWNNGGEANYNASQNPQPTPGFKKVGTVNNVDVYEKV